MQITRCVTRFGTVLVHVSPRDDLRDAAKCLKMVIKLRGVTLRDALVTHFLVPRALRDTAFPLL